jgi:hypothetical protein
VMASYRAARVRDYLDFPREYVAVVVGPAIIVIVGAPWLNGRLGTRDFSMHFLT